MSCLHVYLWVFMIDSPLPVPRCGTMTCLRVGFRVFHASLYIPVLRCYYDLLEGRLIVLFGHNLAADSCFVFGEGRGEGVKRQGGWVFHQFGK